LTPPHEKPPLRATRLKEIDILIWASRKAFLLPAFSVGRAIIFATTVEIWLWASFTGSFAAGALSATSAAKLARLF
jgi:hypothetical protein